MFTNENNEHIRGSLMLIAVTKCHQACDGRTNCLSLISDHHSKARNADMILFLQDFVMTMSVTFSVTTDHSKKVMT